MSRPGRSALQSRRTAGRTVVARFSPSTRSGSCVRVLCSRRRSPFRSRHPNLLDRCGETDPRGSCGIGATVDAAAQIGAGRYERTESRATQRNGSRPKLISTQAGDVELAIPKLRQGSFFPVILERRRRIDQALYAVVMEAWVNGVSTRAVDDLVQALGIGSGISKSEVSRICAGLDEQVAAFRTRTLHHTTFPYVFLDATYLHVRRHGQVSSMAVVVATGVTADRRPGDPRRRRRGLRGRSVLARLLAEPS